jgi:hypothetical protein
MIRNAPSQLYVGRSAVRVEVVPLESAPAVGLAKKVGVPGPAMSEPAGRPTKPDGSKYAPGERLAMSAAALARGGAGKGRRPPEPDPESSDEEPLDYEAELERATGILQTL